MIYLVDDFSFHYPEGTKCLLFQNVDVEEVKELIKNNPYESFVWSEPFASIFQSALDVPVSVNEQSPLLTEKDTIVVGLCSEDKGEVSWWLVTHVQK